MICTQQVRDSTHDGCHALQRVANISIMTFVMVHNRLTCSIMQVILLQHGHCTFVIILLDLLPGLFINLTLCTRALFTKSATTLGLVEQALWRVPLFTE